MLNSGEYAYASRSQRQEKQINLDNHRDKYNLPIYTLRLPNARIYVVNSLALTSSVQKAHKTLSFDPLVAKASIRLTQLSKTTFDIVNTDLHGDGYVPTFYTAIHP